MRKILALERSLIAWAVGALVGAVTFLAEAILGPALFRWGPLAAYSVAGGAVALVSRSLLAVLVSAPAARAGALGAIAAFGSLHALHYVNVHLLPGEHYLSWKSLSFDGVVALPMLAAAVLLGRAGWAQVARVRWSRAGAVMGALALVAGVAVAATTATHPGTDVGRHGVGPDLLLVVMDSVRGDRFTTDPPHPAAPDLSRLAARGRVFTSAWAASSWTVPSVARLLSTSASGETPDLAERLATHGYSTAAFTDNPHLGRRAPLMRGFDRMERSVPRWRSVVSGTALGELVERLAPGSDERLVTKALAWTERQTGPVFLFADLMDSHTPYRFPPLDGKRRPGRRIEFPSSNMRLTSDEADSIRARYDGGVRSADAQVGRLIAAIVARGRPFLAIVTSDHGESLGEDGRWFHGHSLAPELLSIPLVVLGTDIEPGVEVTPVGHAAIPSTLMAAATLPSDKSSGADLRRKIPPQLVQGTLPPHLAYCTDGRYKLVVDFETGRRSLYDRASDPGERHDIANTMPTLVHSLGSKLTASTQPYAPPPEQPERLRALGYAGS